MQRIGIDIRPLLEARRAGVPIYASEMTRALIARADRKYALFLNAWRSPGNKMPTADVPPESPLVEHRFHGYPNRLLNAGLRVGLPHLEQLMGNVDAVWLPNLNFASSKKPMVVTVHDLSFVRYPRFFTPKQRLWHRLLGVRGLLRGATAIVAVSEHTKADVMECFGIPAERITVASPGVSARYAPQSPEAVAAVRTKHGLQKPFFLFLGTLEPRKNVECIIRAFNALNSDTELVIAGGKGWMHETIFETAARSNKKDRIRFLGYVDESDKPGLYTAATALVYPSFYEGFGIPPVEAMACGTPVIASRDSSLGETVSDAGVLVDPYDVLELSRAMSAMLSDEPSVARLRTAGMERAKRFTWEKSAATLASVFDLIKL